MDNENICRNCQKPIGKARDYAGNADPFEGEWVHLATKRTILTPAACSSGTACAP